MPQPPRYERDKDFTLDFGNETDHSALNAEFDSAANSINDIRTNLAILQADDGKLRPSVVTPDSISPELRLSLVEGVIIDAQDMLNQSQAAAAAAEAAKINAASSSSAAQSSATTASTAATAATGAAAAATSAANSADASKTAAAASQAAAASSASNAQASATSAQSSATTASASASTATTKASEASASASTAVTKAAEASASAATATTKANEASTSASQAAASALSINPANLVHMTGDENIAGIKTFSSSPVVPTVAPSDNSTKAASTAFVQANKPGEASTSAAGISRYATYEEATGFKVANIAIRPDFVPGMVATVLNALGAAPVYAARAWVNFNGTGTVAIRGSGNVSSITDNAVGDYTVNFATPMPDANYAISTSIDHNSPSTFTLTPPNGRAYTLAGSVRLYAAFSNAANNGGFDPDSCSVAIIR